jgi:hypothetical protein
MKKLLAVLFVALAVSGPVAAFNFYGLEFESGYMGLFNTVEDSAVNPFVANPLGLSGVFDLTPSLQWRQDVQFFTQAYQYVGDRAVPEQPDFYDVVTVASLLINPVLEWNIPLVQGVKDDAGALVISREAGADPRHVDVLTLNFDAGLGFLFRVPVYATDDTTKAMMGPIAAYFINGRFLYPNVGLGLLWRFSEKAQSDAVFLRPQLHYPVFNHWTAQTWWDQLAVTVILGYRHKF